MRHIYVCVLAASAFAAPASADPLAINPDAYAASQRLYARSAQPPMPQPSAAGYAQPTGPSLGGGLIEFLFGGMARQAAAPQGYQPAQQISYSAAPQGYALQQPGYAVQPGYAPQGYAVQQPGYAVQQGYEQQAAIPAQGYAPSGEGDMAHPPMDPKFERQEVAYNGHETPGTIIIDTPDKFLYLIEDHGRALRYGIGVGRPGFTWAGEKTITAKREWPDWRPPDDMLKRRPDLPRYMAGGPDNPLGARAMYLGSTLYRIHGSNEPWTIGTQVSSGCIRMRNSDVIDLYGRVKVGTKVVVI